MNVKTGFSFPRPEQLEAIKTFYAGINGADSFEPKTERRSGVWCAEIHCSRVSHLPSGDTECCFKITHWRDKL